jgi:predicted nucleic acid-binding Zn ribbon protein
MMARRIKCAVCGEVFISDTWNASICSDKCRAIRSRERAAKERARMKEGSEIYDGRRKNVEKHISTMKQLTNDAIEANKRGMTYGKYIALVKERANRGV